MIIALGGRLKSGKTELAEVCKRNGYRKLYFALPLKTLIANLIDGTIEDVNRLKNVEAEYIFNDEKIKFISDETNIPLEIVTEKIQNKVFHNTRELLQFIGTDLIRHYNYNWHVNKLSQMIEQNVDYVIDDVRFKNEKEFLDSIGAVCFFIVRPNLDSISNHESETSLKWQDFSNLIINDKSLDYLKFNWENFIRNGIIQSIVARGALLNKVRSDKNVFDSLFNTTELFNTFDSLFVNKCEFTYNPKYYTNGLENVKKIENFNNKLFRVYNNDGGVEIVTNPLMIEDLKFYYNGKQ